jgi:hypothetical protein
MADRTRFAKTITSLKLSHTERAIAFLWYYRQTQEFEERTASELANDLHDEGFPKPNVTRLGSDLARSRLTITGRRSGSFQIDVRRLSDLEEKYGGFLRTKKVEVHWAVIPTDWVTGTRVYLEQLVYQINGSYEFGFYDACATMSRRLMESLIIEVYIQDGRHHEIQSGGVFLGLERLIAHVRSDETLTLGRNTPKTMTETKQLGDTAAHDRVYITSKQDIDDIRARYRRMLQDLLSACGIRK